MTGSIPPPNPLSYSGQVVVPFICRTFSPLPTNNTFPVPTIWLNTNISSAFILVSKAQGVAIWAPIGGAPGEIDTITLPDATVIVPSAGNINFLDGDGMTITGSGNNITFTATGGGDTLYPITPYVVGPIDESGYQTIQDAIDAANTAGGGAVYIQPGQYTEDLILYDGVDLYGTPAVSQNQGSTTTIIGTHTPPDSGHVGFNSICFIASGTTNAFSSNAAGSTHLVFLNVESAVQNGYFLNLPNWTGTLEFFDINPNTAGAPFAVNDGGINNTGGSTLFMFGAEIGSGTNIMNLSGLSVVGQASFGCPVTFGSGSDISIQNVQFFEQVTLDGDATGSFDSCNFYGGTDAAIAMSSSGSIEISASTVSSSNDPSIDGSGAGVLSLTGCSFLDNYQIANTLTTNAGVIRGGNFITQYVVGASPDAHFQTIQSALDAANADGGGMVWVKAGTYTEDLTFYNNIQLFGDSEQGTFIVGIHTPPSSGTLNINRCNFESATSIFSSNAAGTSTIIVEDCTLTANDGYAFDLLNWTSSGALGLFNIASDGADDGGINNTGGMGVFAFEAGVGSGPGVNYPTNLSGGMQWTTSELNVPIVISSDAAFTFDYCFFGGNVELTSTSSGSFSFSRFTTEATSALTISTSGDVSFSNNIVDTSATNAIDGSGAGTITITGCDFLQSASIAGTLTVDYGVSISGIDYLQNISFDGGTTTLDTDGQVWIGSTGDNPQPATITAGTGVSIVNGAGSITINATGGGLSWQTINTGTITAVPGNGYFTFSPGGNTFNLPSNASSTTGDTFKVACFSAATFVIATGAGNSIILGNQNTSAFGTVTSSGNQGDIIELTYATAGYWVAQADSGNFTVT